MANMDLAESRQSQDGRTSISAYGRNIDELSKLYGKEVIPANREWVEQKNDIIESAIAANTAFLVIGDPFSATTHLDLVQRANEEKIKVEIIHNASILTAVGITGLELYKFGRVASIPFNNKEVKTPVDILNQNQKANLHTLFLLDLNPKDNIYLTLKDAIEYLIKNKINKELGSRCRGLFFFDFLEK